METEKVISISDIITWCGGVAVISKAVEITDNAVAKWRKNGIPDRYWKQLIDLSNQPLDETILFNANEQIRLSTSLVKGAAA